MLQNRRQDVYIVVNSQRIWYRQKKRIRFSSIASSENGASIIFNNADFIDSIGILPKKISVLFCYQCKNRPAHRNPWLTLMSCFFPGFFVQPDLFCLLYMKRLAAFVEFQSRTLQVHSVFGRPNSGSIRSSSPPNTVPQSFGVGFQSQ